MPTKATITAKDRTPREIVRDVAAAWRRAAGTTTVASLDLYERQVDQIAAAEVKAVNGVRLPVVAGLVERHADVIRRISTAQVNRGRRIVKS
jgi:hypothetical protein